MAYIDARDKSDMELQNPKEKDHNSCHLSHIWRIYKKEIIKDDMLKEIELNCDWRDNKHQ